jgi:hypothetical protein
VITNTVAITIAAAHHQECVTFMRIVPPTQTPKMSNRAIVILRLVPGSGAIVSPDRRSD